MTITIQDAVKQLHNIVKELRDTYPIRKFTLDGRLVGDIGEIWAKENYAIKLYPKQQKRYDAETIEQGAKVQIKATMKNSLTFPVDVPELYLGIKIDPDEGKFEVRFNGPGKIISKAINEHRLPKTNIPTTSPELKRLYEEVTDEEKIPSRPNLNIR